MYGRNQHNIVKQLVKSLSCIWLFATPWTVAHQAPLSGILQARILEWVAISFSRGSSWPRDQTQASRIAGRCFNLWATKEACTAVNLQLNKFKKGKINICLKLLLLPAKVFSIILVRSLSVVSESLQPHGL